MAVLQKLTTGQLLDRVFSIYRRNFLLFFGIAIVPQFALIITAISPLAARSGLPPGAGNPVTYNWGAMGAFWIVSLILSSLAQGSATHAVSDIYLEQPTSIASCFQRTGRKSISLTLLSFGYGLLIGLGLVLLIVPGIYWAITYALAFPAMVVEDLSFSEAFTRSKDLVAGNRGRIALIGLLSVCVTWIIALALGLPLGYLKLSLIGHFPGAAIAIDLVVKMFANALAMPVGLIGFTLAYYDARVEKEAFDLHYMMAQEPATPGSVQV
jgi:hypothetical protein